MHVLPAPRNTLGQSSHREVLVGTESATTVRSCSRGSTGTDTNVGAPRAAAAEKAWKTSVKAGEESRWFQAGETQRHAATVLAGSRRNTASTRPSGSGRTDGIMAAFVLLACLGAMAFFLRRRFAIVGLGCGTDGQGNAAIEIWIVI